MELLEYIPFADTLGIKIEQAEPDRIVARLTVDRSICTTGKIMHGGAIMAFADTLGACGAYLNLPEGAKATTTIDSKTNFLGPAPMDSEVVGICTPVHVGRRTSVWQTRIERPDGKAVALVIQTQMVLS